MARRDKSMTLLCCSLAFAGYRRRVFARNSHKATRNADSFSRIGQPGLSPQVLAATFLTSIDWCPLCPALISWLTFFWLLAPVDCSLLLPFSWLFLWDRFSLVHFRSRGRSRMKDICVGFMPKHTKGFPGWYPQPTETNATHRVTIVPSIAMYHELFN